jgi:hypothetical protein
MSSAEHYREQAAALREKAKAATDPDEKYAYLLGAIGFDAKAEEAEQGQVQQHGDQLPPALPSRDRQPAQQQQQQQAQPEKEGG